MRSLAAPVRDAVADLEQCARTTRGVRRAAVRARQADVLGLYDAYLAARGQPGTVAESRDWAEADHFFALFDFLSDRRSLSALRSSLKDAAGNLCLLCSFRQVDGLDHHLPRAHHPALSILPSNLVPACTQCNGLKGSDCHPDAARQFSHPYFDAIPRDVPWLVCEPFDQQGVWSPLFDIDVGVIADANTRLRVRRQFDHLQLSDDYHTAAVQYVSGFERSWSTTVETDGVDALLRQLRNDIGSLSIKHGASYWQAVLHRGLLADSRFRDDPMAMLGNPLPLPPEYR